MSARPDFDAFTEFLIDAEPELRHATGRYTSDPTLTDWLLLHSATSLASRWRVAAADDPMRHLLAALERHGNAQWQDGHTVLDEPHRTMRQLAQTAWLSGRRMRRQRHQRTGLFLLVGALIIAMYLWSLNVSPLEAQNEPGHGSGIDSPSKVTVIDATVVALPPPDVIARTPFVPAVVPGDLDVIASQAPPITDSAVDSIAAVFRSDDNWPIVVAPDGLARSVDLSAVVGDPTRLRLWPRAISPDGTRFAMASGNSVLVVAGNGDLQTMAMPENSGALLEISWLPDSRSIQVSAETGSWLLAPGAEPEPLRWYGEATTFHSDSQQPVEFTPDPASDVSLREWNGTEFGSTLSADDPPAIAAWRDAPFADDNRYVRGCLPGEHLPTGDRTATWCVAVMDAQAQVERVLIADDRYSGVTVLGAWRGEIYLSVRTTEEADQRILVWRVSDDRLLNLTTVSHEAQVALHPW
ncbi:hypothetical protein FB566_2980 [Stackebrandtia endophytica]|uniref:Uncharacterized protein n=1 Tax=Stackebrandtia endophytica TaxID=1496996 RepID=A0A543AXW7_9ACTN|nr:hypothetical protein [Stackebrandtia endophytica]TQL77421.1 hypothetical protein FB566_2980 [Stackebrandtia endophytica]